MDAGGTDDRLAGGPVDSDAASSGMLGKALALLELVAMADQPPRFTDLLALSGRPRGTLHRQLAGLVEEGLLVLRPDQRYEPGLRLLKLAAKTWSRNGLREVAAPHLKALHALTGETVHFGVLQGTEVIYLDKVESLQAVRMSSQIGRASPVYCTGLGKAALAALPSAERQAILDRLQFKPFTPATHRNAQTLSAELDDIARLGHAFDREEHEAGICCVAAAIRAPAERLVAGISVTGPAYRVSPVLLEAWAEPVRRAARAIEEALFAGLGPGHALGGLR